MKSSSNKERSEFERSWQNAFDQAHMEPGSRVWENIDAHLTNAENGKFKRKIILYKWVAAASLLIGIGLSYLAIDHVYFNEARRLSAVENREKSRENDRFSEEGSTATPGNESGKEDRRAAEDGKIKEDKTASGNITHQGEVIVAEKENLAAKNEGEKNEPENEPASRSERPAAQKAKGSADGHQEQLAEQPALAKGEGSGTQAPSTRTEGLSNGESTAPVAGNVVPETGTEEPADKKEIVPELENKGPRLITQPRMAKAALITVAGEQDIVPRSTRTMPAVHVEKMAGLGYDLKYHADLYQMAIMYKIPGIEPLLPEDDQEDGKEDKSRFFAGVSFSSGMFDPNFTEGNTAIAEKAFVNATGAQSDKIVSPFLADRFQEVANNNEKTSPAFSYAYGINVGKRLSKRWVIQGGIKYGRYSSTTSTSAYVQDPVNNKVYPLHLVTNAESSFQTNKRITATRDYELQNNFEFISIPLEAGYIVLDRKIDVLVSAGVGTRIFLKNNLEDKSNLFEDVEVTPGAESPYKDLFFNGLLSAEVSYQFAGHYTISLSPSYSMALSTFTKSETAFTSNPKSLSMALGLRYFF